MLMVQWTLLFMTRQLWLSSPGKAISTIARDCKRVSVLMLYELSGVTKQARTDLSEAQSYFVGNTFHHDTLICYV